MAAVAAALAQHGAAVGLDVAVALTAILSDAAVEGGDHPPGAEGARA
jgi:hypothetical protein